MSCHNGRGGKGHSRREHILLRYIFQATVIYMSIYFSDNFLLFLLKCEHKYLFTLYSLHFQNRLLTLVWMHLRGIIDWQTCELVPLLHNGSFKYLWECDFSVFSRTSVMFNTLWNWWQIKHNVYPITWTKWINYLKVSLGTVLNFRSYTHKCAMGRNLHLYIYHPIYSSGYSNTATFVCLTSAMYSDREWRALNVS